MIYKNEESTILRNLNYISKSWFDVTCKKERPYCDEHKLNWRERCPTLWRTIAPIQLLKAYWIFSLSPNSPSSFTHLSQCQCVYKQSISTPSLINLESQYQKIELWLMLTLTCGFLQSAITFAREQSLLAQLPAQKFNCPMKMRLVQLM